MITYCFIHHFGGFARDPLASTQHLTEQVINNAHKSRWPDFPSKLNGSHIGYNVVIYPSHWAQYRYIGEETAANKGYNLNAISIALAGNFDLLGGSMIDTPTPYQVETLTKLIRAILAGTPETEGLKVIQGAQLNVTLANVLPHRYVSRTNCYGFGLSNSWVKDLITPVDDRIITMQNAINELWRLLTLLKQKQFGGGAACWEADEKDPC